MANYLILGGFKCLIDTPYPSPPQCFLCLAYKYAPEHSQWPPVLTNKHKADLAQAQYTWEEMTTLASLWAVLCAKCLQWGHQKTSCQARLICIQCLAPGHKAFVCPQKMASTIESITPVLSPSPTGSIAPTISMHKSFQSRKKRPTV